MLTSKIVTFARMFKEIDGLEKENKNKSLEVLEIPIGITGSKIQNLVMKTTDSSAHAAIIGGTGSGKSNLLHAIIINACYKYNPDELNLWIVDFKSGIEFECYKAYNDTTKQLPHIKLMGVISKIEDSITLLNNLKNVIKERKEIFRKYEVETFDNLEDKGVRLPRLLVLIDEIQELFMQDYRIAPKIVNLLDEIYECAGKLGVSILWTSRNIPNDVNSFKSKVLIHIANKICLWLNNPEDATEFGINSSKVENMSRLEYGFGIINDSTFDNDGVEFRIVYAENNETREFCVQKILDKWLDTKKGETPSFLIIGDGAL